MAVTVSDDQLLAPLRERTSGALTYWIRNVIACTLRVQRSQLPVSLIRRRLTDLEREGTVVSRRGGPGVHIEWTLASVGLKPPISTASALPDASTSAPDAPSIAPAGKGRTS